MWFANVKPALQAAGVAFQGEPRSRLVLIGASAVQSPIPADIVHYGMAKSQVAMLAETLSLSLNVLLVLPSTMDTPKNRKAMPGADFSKWLSTDAVAIAIEEWCKLAPDKPGFTVRSM
jgi:NAD(P)-dependent dehydrogenase (short-subunit alcohol dehydrogenase family)